MKLPRSIGCLAAVLLGTSCALAAEEVGVQPVIDAFTGKNQKVVFEGIVVERLPSPGFWCGFLASYQGISYLVTKVIVGPVPENAPIVYHALVRPPLCEVEEDGKVVMSKKIFAVGNHLRIVAERTPSGELVGWEQETNVFVLKYADKEPNQSPQTTPVSAPR